MIPFLRTLSVKPAPQHVIVLGLGVGASWLLCACKPQLARISFDNRHGAKRVVVSGYGEGFSCSIPARSLTLSTDRAFVQGTEFPLQMRISPGPSNDALFYFPKVWHGDSVLVKVPPEHLILEAARRRHVSGTSFRCRESKEGVWQLDEAR